MHKKDFEPGFSISDGKGFQVRLENGWTVSVQFGPGNYCDNYRMDTGDETRRKAGSEGSRNAEIAAWDADGKWFEFEDGNEVEGYQTASQVLAFVNKIAAMPAKTTDDAQ